MADSFVHSRQRLATQFTINTSGVARQRAYVLSCPRCGCCGAVETTGMGEVGVNCAKCNLVYVIPRRVPTESECADPKKGQSQGMRGPRGQSQVE